MQEIDTKLLESKFPDFVKKFKSSILAIEDFRGEFRVVIAPGSLLEIVDYIVYTMPNPLPTLVDLFGMDYLKTAREFPERFAVIYQFAEFMSQSRLWLKVFVPEANLKIPTLTGIIPAANWFEREVWDLFGIEFENHPNLIRILCHSQFEGHPLRKDYPANGFQRLNEAIPSKEL